MLALASACASPEPAAVRHADGPYIAARPEALEGRVIGAGHCVDFVTAAGVPRTVAWREGALVRGNPGIARGTAIATFEADGSYTSESGNHAAIYLGQDHRGIWVYDQWRGQPVHKRLIRFGGGRGGKRGSKSNDGGRFAGHGTFGVPASLRAASDREGPPERPPPREPFLQGSTAMAYTQREILIAGLKNAYALEAHAADVTHNQARRLGDYPELQRRVQQHHEETLRQRDRLGECLSELGESPSTLKDSVLRLVGNMQTMFHATADDEVLKGAFASVSLEHYEIAAYKSLVTMAEACNERAVAEVCRQNLHEEEAMAQFLDGNIEQVTRTYLAKASGGRESQSGVM